MNCSVVYLFNWKESNLRGSFFNSNTLMMFSLVLAELIDYLPFTLFDNLCRIKFIQRNPFRCNGIRKYVRYMNRYPSKHCQRWKIKHLGLGYMFHVPWYTQVNDFWQKKSPWEVQTNNIWSQYLDPMSQTWQNVNISQKRNKICVFVVVAIVFQKVNRSLVAD